MSEPRPQPTPTKRQLAEVGPHRTIRVARIELAVIALLFVVVALMVGYALGQRGDKQSAQHQAKTLYSQVATGGATPSVTPVGVPPASAIIGPAGRQGRAGVAGPSGASGRNGSRGPRGSRGPSGKPGASGNAGQQGSNGQNGAQGPAGQSGVAGPQGVQGPQGSTGPQGPKGDTGSDGASGGPGEPPESWTFTVPSLLGDTTYTCTRDPGFDPDAPTYTCQPETS